MRLQTNVLITAITYFSLTLGTAAAGDFQTEGIVGFSNVQNALSFGGDSAPYLAIGTSPQIGFHLHSGSVLPLPETILPTDTGIEFECVQGPHEREGRNIHVIHTKRGKIYCTWHAVFTLDFINDQGDAVLSGDGIFTVVGGTRHYRGASGSFRTLFETEVVKAGSDTALAEFTQEGELKRK